MPQTFHFKDKSCRRFSTNSPWTYYKLKKNSRANFAKKLKIVIFTINPIAECYNEFPIINQGIAALNIYIYISVQRWELDEIIVLGSALTTSLVEERRQKWRELIELINIKHSSRQARKNRNIPNVWYKNMILLKNKRPTRSS